MSFDDTLNNVGHIADRIDETKEEDASLGSSGESASNAGSAMLDAIDDNMSNPDAMIEICGLTENSNGRACNLHDCCGKTVTLNDILRLKRCVVEVDDMAEEAIKLVKLSGGYETCTVGFLPRIYYNLTKVKQNINQNVQVIKLYKDGSSYEKQKDRVNGGMATCIFLNDIPFEE